METIVAENRRLEEENAGLRQLLAENGITVPAPAKKAVPGNRANGKTPV